jgi:hypothetical protein
LMFDFAEENEHGLLMLFYDSEVRLSERVSTARSLNQASIEFGTMTVRLFPIDSLDLTVTRS